MSTTSLSLGLNLPRLEVGELMFLLNWSAGRVDKFPHFSKWIALLASGELGRRMTPGMESGSIDLPDLRGAEAADFLLASFCLGRSPLTESLATFADDLAKKIVCDIAGTLEHQEAVDNE